MPKQIRTLADASDQIVDSLTGELSFTLGDEQPGQLSIANLQIALDRPQFVAIQRMMRREAAFEAADPDARGL